MRSETRFQERLTQAAEANDDAGSLEIMFSRRSSPKRSIVVAIPVDGIAVVFYDGGVSGDRFRCLRQVLGFYFLQWWFM
ncbi:putative femABX peptidyl transferase [Helianthus annuus]|nr:putative femABX peptidyl transferase [Helianthus annuus]